jgi:hypothetical protein
VLLMSSPFDDQVPQAEAPLMTMRQGKPHHYGITRRLGPHSKVLMRGSVGELDGRSREAKFLRHVQFELAKHVGGSPNFAQQLLIRRCARAMLRLELMDKLAETGNWSNWDGRVFGALSNHVRLCLRELGVMPSVVDKTPSLEEIAARHKAKPPNPRAKMREPA